MNGDTVAPQAPYGDGPGSERRAPGQRLRASREVRAVFATRRAAVSPLAVLHVRDRAVAGPARFTVVAGRKVGGAVDRNRVKRRLRAVLAELPLHDGVDYVVVGRRGALTAPFEDLRTRLADQLREAHAR